MRFDHVGIRADEHGLTAAFFPLGAGRLELAAGGWMLQLTERLT